MTSVQASDRSSRFASIALSVVSSLYILVTIVAFWRAVAALLFRVPLDPNEGWNAYHALAAMTGGALYPDVHSYFVNNYPPLSFYFVGIFGRMLGDNIIAGRIVSLVSFLGVGLGIFKLTRLMGCRLREAALAAFLFATWLLVGSDYVGMDDPQLLGDALDIAALFVLLRSERTVWISALLFALAFFVKHNLVALPLASTAWLIVYDRARAPRFVAFLASFALIGFLSFRLIYGSDLLAHLASARIYSFGLLISNVGQWLAWSAVPIVLTGFLLERSLVGWDKPNPVIARLVRATHFLSDKKLGRPHEAGDDDRLDESSQRDPAMAIHIEDKFAVFCAIYAGVAIVLGVAASGGAGVDTNAFFDADIALSLGVGVALNRLSARGSLPLALATASLALPLVAGLYLAYNGAWSDSDYWLHPGAEDAVVAQRDIAFLQDHKGPALCETLSLCYWAGKNAEVDVFNVGQEFATGARSDGDIVGRIHAHTFAAIEFDSLNPFSLTPHVRAALLSAYRVDHTDDNGIFLVRR